MKKFLSAFLAALTLLSAAACSGTKSSGSEAAATPPASPTDNHVPEAPGSAGTPASQAPGSADDLEITSDLIFGSYSAATNTYENHFIGIGCRLDDDWEVFDAEQIAALNGLMVDLMTDEAIANQLANSGSLMPFYAQTSGGLITLNITVENLGVLYGSMLDEQGYAELSLEQISPALEGIGFSDVAVEVGSMSFAGGTHAAIQVSSSLQGVLFYETLVCVKVGSYIANITAASYTADVTGDVLSLFYSL